MHGLINAKQREVQASPVLPLTLGRHPLEKVDTFKYQMMKDLSWSAHTQTISSKARRVLGLLYRTFYNHSSTDVLVQLYMCRW